MGRTVAPSTSVAEHFDAAFDDAPIGMALFNCAGEYVRVNDALCTLLDRAPEQLIGRRDQELTHPDDRAADLVAAEEIFAGLKRTFQCEKRFVRPDGTIVWALANLTFLRDDEGRPLSWVGQFQDITSRRATEEALRASERRHRLIVRNLPGAGVVLYDRDLCCVLIEGRHMEDTGAITSDFTGRPMREIVSPELLELLEPAARWPAVGRTRWPLTLGPFERPPVGMGARDGRSDAGALAHVLRQRNSRQRRGRMSASPRDSGCPARAGATRPSWARTRGSARPVLASGC